MIIVEKHGRPDICVTMTCNSGLLQMKKALHTFKHIEMESHDTPVLIAIFFNLTLKALLQEILSGKLFRTIIVYVLTTLVPVTWIATCTHAFYNKT